MQKSKNHHWWPVALQSYWADKNRDVSWIEPDGKISRKRFENRKIGVKRHGHTSLKGSEYWEMNFENEFDIDSKIHELIKFIRSLKPLGHTLAEFIHLIKLLFKRERTLKDSCKFFDLQEKTHRDLLLLIFSILIRSPASRSRCESYPTLVGLPRMKKSGK